MNKQFENKAEEAEYWKKRFSKYRADVEFFVGGTMLLFCIILVEYIIKHYFEVPIVK